MGFRAEQVKPERWNGIEILFDDVVYSVVAGVYRSIDGSVGERLGERWNGNDETLGFPNQAGNPLWHRVPDFLAVPMLHGLLDELAKCPNRQVPESNLPDGTQTEARRSRILKQLAQRFGQGD